MEKPLVAESSRWGIYRLSSLSQTGCSASCLSEVAETSTWNSGRTWQLRETGRRLLCLAHTPQWFVSVLPITPATGQTRPLPQCAETMGSLDLAITTHLANWAQGSHTGPSAFRLVR